MSKRRVVIDIPCGIPFMDGTVLMPGAMKIPGKPINVTHEFNPSKVIGVADDFQDDGTQTTAELDVPGLDSMLDLTPAVGISFGVTDCHEESGIRVIDKCVVNSVSLVTQHMDPNMKSLRQQFENE